MRELGEGMRRMFESIERNYLEKPQLVSSGGSFSVVLRNRSVFNQREEDWLGLFHEFGLSRLQKRIVAAGIDGKELSPKDIYRAMNTEDRDTYDLQVTGLRQANILTEIRSSVAAQHMSRQKRVPKATIPRFRVPNAPPAQQELPAIGKQSPPERELYPEETGVFIGNLDAATTKEEIRSLLQRFGGVRRVILNWDKRPGIPGKYAIVWLESSDQAEKAVDVLYGFKLKGQELLARRFRAQRTRSYARNFPRTPRW
jgi:ATP-dependent DNA helicase RecG